MFFEKLKSWYNSEEGQKAHARFIEKLEKEKEIETKQLERFNRLGNFSEFTEKVIAKYSSDKYRDYWYNRGIEPPEDLLWFLFQYAEKYGRECNEEEWVKHANMFTSALYFCNGYYFNRMDGQGTIIQVTKAD